jgi:uncharacterized protein (DUF1684 family)
MTAAREARDRAFGASNDPIPQEKHATFLPLAYFPPDPNYRVPAVLKPSANQQTVTMPTSTGQNRQMFLVGTLEFTLKGQPMSLGAFVDAESKDLNRLFVPFSDMTSGTETYAAGRYLDLDRTPTGIYVIDFNRAYHPFCYFNAAYDCPYPPPANRLKTPVHAGERLRR